LTLRHSLIRNSGGNGLVAAMGAPIVVEDSDFTGNGLSAIRLTMPATVPPILRQVRASGNGQNAVTWYAIKIENEQTWLATGLPYRIEGGSRLNQRVR
jgi:hypothetical protein